MAKKGKKQKNSRSTFLSFPRLPSLKVRVNTDQKRKASSSKKPKGIKPSIEPAFSSTYDDKDDFDSCMADDSSSESSSITKTQIYGLDHEQDELLPIVTDSKGRLKISNPSKRSIEYIEESFQNIHTSNCDQFTQSFDLSKITTSSFIIINIGCDHCVHVRLEVSPDDYWFQEDIPTAIIPPRTFKILTPTRFLRYARLAYRSQDLDKNTIINIFYQAQSS